MEKLTEWSTAPGSAANVGWGREGGSKQSDVARAMLPEIAFGKHNQVALDVGCGVTSFGAYLLSRNVITLPKTLMRTRSNLHLNVVYLQWINWTRDVTTHGINAGDDKKLRDAGIYTCNGLMMHTKKRKSVVRITTGSQALDELLGVFLYLIYGHAEGGIETTTITEAFVEFRSGKTQLAHTLCVSTQLPINMKGGNGKVEYIDTEGTFSQTYRITPIAERFGMDPRAVLGNIIYARAYTYKHQYNLLLGLAAKMAEEPFKILIVDLVIALFRVDFTRRGELADYQQKLAQMLSRLIKIVEEFNIDVYMTNQVIVDLGGGVFISDPKKPAGGHVLAHVATICYYMLLYVVIH
ncbi:meiotic recombination protein dmc1 homolog [Phtheirospermum japonicum]|uniref:Meiotic recombination protein dmc1 homolog n=1 Tax=Phtheirospermum japonicum TaxID=374723 RepID=A0A830BI20_9LAMI|nr:meiotic recombination protein dmc1 homolog [Phtheirospermum japonicum]